MSKDNVFSDYGPQKGLQEILEELAVYCAEAGCDNPSITVILPKQAQDHFNLQFAPKEKYQLAQKQGRSAVTQFWCAGVVTIHNDSDYEAVQRDKKVSLWGRLRRFFNAYR